MHRTLPLPSIVRITNLNNHASVLVRVNDRGPSDTSRLIDVSQPVAEYLNFSKTSVTPVQVELMVAESHALKKQLQQKSQNEKKIIHQQTVKQTEKVYTGGETVINADDILYPGMSQQDIQKLKVSQSSNQPVMPKTQKTIIKQSISNDNDIVYSGKTDMAEIKPYHPVKLYNMPTESYYIQIGAFSQQESVDKIKRKLATYPHLFVQDKTKNGRTLHQVRIGPFESSEVAQKTLDKVHRSGYVESKIIYE